MGFLNDILGFLGDAVLADIETFLVYLYQLTVQVFLVLYQLLQLIGAYLLQLFKSAANFLAHVWNNFFRDIFQRVWSAVKAAQQWIEARLRPVIDFLKRVRRFYDVWFNTYLRPLLNLLQRIRQYLQILSLLHIHIATVLDNYIAQLESKLVQAFATVRAAINTLIDVSNALMDPGYLLRKPALLLSIRRQLPALIHAVTGKPPGYWFPSPRGAAGGAFAPVSASFSFADPAQNPNTSSYLGFEDGIPESPPLDIGYTISVDAVDQVAPLDYFNDALWPLPLCTDTEECFQRAYDLALTTLQPS